MIKTYVTEIAYSDFEVPTCLGFIFIGGQYVQKIALVRPAKKDKTDTHFKFGLKAILNPGDIMRMYANEKRYYFNEIGFESEDELVKASHGSLNFGHLETSQDMKASGYNIQNFPELKAWLE